MLVRMRGNRIPHSWHVGLQHGAAALFLLLFFKLFILYWDFPDGASGKESTCQSRRWGGGSLCRPPGGGNGNPLQCSCLENPMDGGALAGYSPWGLKESDTTEVTEHAGKVSSVLLWVQYSPSLSLE